MAASDIDAVLALEQQIPEAPHWRREDYEQSLITDPKAALKRAAFVAESGPAILGFSGARLVAGIAELESIAVAPGARGQGIGKALLQAVLTWAAELEAVRLELEVRASNHRAIMVYERCGLRREGLRPGYYQSPSEDAVLMSLELPASGKLL